ncbi:hypothetical protein L3V59_07320 [Burkholderia aenigmatica]|uniref:hypothetical protein n=1 Tax=Burkholderia aenigmatica TaxID=2015348 RepID=UPI001F17D243|nr:hypothetical protein [Burkholderia aenigmatica]UKD12857.1 hypothetical protein L3V59_07320 [Burkholderia aenigmatica]
MITGLRGTAWIAAIFVAVWAAVLVWWKTTYHAPTARELLLCGLVLPAALAICAAWARRTFTPRTPAGAAAPAAALAPQAAPDAQDAASHTWTALVLDSSVRLPTGETTAEIDAVAREQRPIQLHPDLQRPDGTGVFASTVESVSLDRLDKRLLPPDAGETLKDEHWRGLLLAADALDELRERHAALSGAGADAAPLKLHLLMPGRWQPVASTLAAWLDAHTARAPIPPGIARVQLRTVDDPVQAWALVDELIQAVHLQPAGDLHIVLAFDSTASQDAVDALDRAGRFYGRDRPNGLTPGEGACALLLAHPDAPHATPVASVHRLTSARRPTSADHGKTESATLGQLLDAARARLTARYPDLSAPGLVSDADLRSSRRTEIVSVAEQAWGDDATERCRHLGLANGTSGTALALTALAVAADRATEDRQAVFAVSISDPLERGVMLVTPALPTEAAAPALQPLTAAA